MPAAHVERQHLLFRRNLVVEDDVLDVRFEVEHVTFGQLSKDEALQQHQQCRPPSVPCGNLPPLYQILTPNERLFVGK